MKTVTDPKDQVTTHSYNVDDSLSGTIYTNAVIATPSVSYTYDPYYARVATMIDGIGTTSYTYKAAGTNGAGQVATIDGPLSNDTIAYSYDQLGRVIQRTINGAANQVDWTFDALGRVTSEENLLGEFTYPTNPDEWQLPRGWREETKAKEATDGRHRHFVGPKGETRRWDAEGREAGKERGPHWHDSRFPGKHISCTR